MQLGEFARREISVLPWVAFLGAYHRHGLEDGLLVAMMVVIVELWVLYIPAKLYVEHRPELDRRAATFARWLNLAIGLLLLTPGNPIYWLVAQMPSRDPESYP
jgi:threonine/homoserine/homoserine lactone efflux protein